MQLALEQARAGERAGEIPVGAAILLDGKVVAVGYNQAISGCDPTAHAEIVAIRAAAKALGNYRLDRCEMYVTLEPCAMCMGAILHSRIAKLYFGAPDPKTGACGSVLNLPGDSRINHHCEVAGGISQAQCAQHLTDYFQRLRKDRRISRRPLREDALRLEKTVLAPFVPNAEPVQRDDLEASKGLGVHVWQHRHAPSNPRCLVLCLHGATSWSYIYHDLLSIDIPPDVMVCAIDLPGHGNSDKTKTGTEFDIAFQLGIINALVVQTKAKTVHIVAQDIGCELGVWLAGENPDRIHGMTFLNPVCSDFLASADKYKPTCSIRSRQQFIAHIADQCGPDQHAIEALCAPYPDAGHMAGLLHRCNSVSTTTSLSMPRSLRDLPSACIENSVVHVGHAFVDRCRQFNTKFGLTFKVVEHDCASALIGLKLPTIWNGVLRQLSKNG